jgi:hypothetical protein
MIDDPYPSDWRELQEGVCRLFGEIGLSAQTEKVLTTPRGVVEVDVYAVDEASVDRIQYIVECKNWSTAIPKTVVHAFATVMAETGANIGFIVSQQGLQSGAELYTNSTNIIGMTYLELQQRYLQLWWSRFFCPYVGDVADDLRQYIEPVNNFRERKVELLANDAKERFLALQERHAAFGMSMSLLNAGRLMQIGMFPSAKQKLLTEPPNFQPFRMALEHLYPNYPWTAQTFRELLGEIEANVMTATREFNSVFGRNIFMDEDGPPTLTRSGKRVA